MIVLAVTIHCKKEKSDEARQLLSSFVTKARSEVGCVQYDFFQSVADENIFYFFEKWADQTAFDLHSKQPYLKEFHNRFDELLEKPNQLIYLKSPQ